MGVAFQIADPAVQVASLQIQKRRDPDRTLKVEKPLAGIPQPKSLKFTGNQDSKKVSRTLCGYAESLFCCCRSKAKILQKTLERQNHSIQLGRTISHSTKPDQTISVSEADKLSASIDSVEAYDQCQWVAESSKWEYIAKRLKQHYSGLDAAQKLCATISSHHDHSDKAFLRDIVSSLREMQLDEETIDIYYFINGLWYYYDSLCKNPYDKMHLDKMTWQQLEKSGKNMAKTDSEEVDEIY